MTTRRRFLYRGGMAGLAALIWRRVQPPPDGDFDVILKNVDTAEVWWVAPYLRSLPSGAGWTDGDRSGYFCLYAFLQIRGRLTHRVTFTRVPVPRELGGAYAGIFDEDMREGQRFYDGTLAPVGSNELGDCPPPTQSYEPYLGADERPTVKLNFRRQTLEVRDYKTVDAHPAITFQVTENTPNRVTVVAYESTKPVIVIYYDALLAGASVTSDIG